MHTIRIDDHRKFVRPWPRQRTPKQLLPDRENGNIDAGHFRNSTGICARRNHDAAGGNTPGLGAVNASGFDLLDFVGHIRCAQLLGSSSKGAQQCSRLDVAVFRTEQSACKIVAAEFRNQPANIGHAQQFAFGAKRFLDFVTTLQFLPIRFVAEKQVPALAELAFRKLFEHSQAVLNHPDVYSRHELLAHSTHGERARSKLVTGIAFDDDDAAFEAILKQVECDARSNDSAANDHNIG